MLGFDPYKVLTFRTVTCGKRSRWKKLKGHFCGRGFWQTCRRAKGVYKYLNLPMAGGKDALGEEIKGIEDYIPNTQYEG